MMRLLRFLKNYKWDAIVGPTLKLLEAIFELIVPLVMAKIIDVGIKNGDVPYVLKMGGVIVILGVCGLAFALVCQYVAARAAYGFGTELRSELFRHINSLSHAEIDKFGTSSLITRLTSDITAAQNGVNMAIRLASRAPFLIIGSAVMAMAMDVKLSLIFFAAAPLVALTLYIIMSKSIPFYSTIQKKLDRISLLTRENLVGARVIRAFSRQQSEQKEFSEACDSHTDSSVIVGKISALLNPLTSVIMNLAIVAIIWFGGYRVDSGALTQGQIIAFVNYMTQISLALVVVANLVIIFTKASASAARINEVFDTKATVTEKAETITERAEGAPRIEFRDVVFSYGGGDPEINHVSFKIMPGETVGIIGGTGSGKSTLVNLIPRFYDTAEGEVLVDGVNVKEYTFADLRGKIGMVPQGAQLFKGTIIKNMRWRNENADIDDIKRAIEISQSGEFVSKLPEGLDTMVMQGGKNFSGGQRQRLTIARALVGSPEILVLDDSSSALDYATDYKLRKAIAENLEGTTVIMISQRASTIKNADKIIVLDDGEAVGMGTHEELMASCEVYREICRSQQTDDSEKEGA